MTFVGENLAVTTDWYFTFCAEKAKLLLGVTLAHGPHTWWKRNSMFFLCFILPETKQYSCVKSNMFHSMVDQNAHLRIPCICIVRKELQPKDQNHSFLESPLRNLCMYMDGLILSYSNAKSQMFFLSIFCL